MVANYLTKSLQGSLFRKLRDFILNVKHEDGPASIIEPDTTGPQKRVGDGVKVSAWADVGRKKCGVTRMK